MKPALHPLQGLFSANTGPRRALEAGPPSAPWHWWWQHSLPASPAACLGQGLEAWLALVTLVPHHSRLAAAPAIAVTLWAKGTCRETGERGWHGHLPTHTTL